MMCAIGGCGGNPTVIASGLDSPLGLAVDSNNQRERVLGQSGRRQRHVVRDRWVRPVPSDAGFGAKRATLVAVDSTDIYWTNAFAGTVMRCSLPGCGSMTTIASGQEYGFFIALDATRVYWGNQGGDR